MVHWSVRGGRLRVVPDAKHAGEYTDDTTDCASQYPADRSGRLVASLSPLLNALDQPARPPPRARRASTTAQRKRNPCVRRRRRLIISVSMVELANSVGGEANWAAGRRRCGH